MPVSIDKIPQRFHPIFPYKHFNEIQSHCFKTIFNHKDNIVINAPTGSGKTALFELAIVKDFDDNGIILYLAPSKAICEERYHDWKSKFSNLNVKVLLITGDSIDKNPFSDNSKQHSLLIATSEKFDVITRHSNHSSLFKGSIKINIKLLLLDEIHFLNDGRGATLEVLFSRLYKNNPYMRIIACSATISNSEDIALWIRGKAMNFGENLRSVPLEKHVIGVDSSHNQNPFAFESNLNSRLPLIIKDYTPSSSGKATIIVRKSILIILVLSNEKKCRKYGQIFD